MVKSLKQFKNKKQSETDLLPLVLEKNQSEILLNDSPTLQSVQAVKLLDQLEKVGFAPVAAKLRGLQVSDGSELLEPMLKRLQAIETRLDVELKKEELDVSELSRLVSLLTSIYSARAKILLLPFGAVNPRTILQGNRAGHSPINIAVGIGTGATPRPK